MYKQTILFICWLFITVHGDGEFSVLHHPASISFKGHDHVRQSTLKEVYAAALGFSIERYSNWHGMYIEDPFNLAEAIVTVVVDGVPSIGLMKGHHFPLRTDEDESNLFHSLERRILDRYPEENNNLVRVDLLNGLEDLQKYDIFHGIKNDKPKKSQASHLRNSVDEDREFLKELTLFNAIIDKVAQGAVSKDYVPDVYWFRLDSLHALQDLYGENSTAVKEARHLLNEALVRLSNAFDEVYGGNVLVTIITSDASHTRKSRSILADPAPSPTEANHNLAKNYNKDYPVVFNIILWFGVVMVFTLLAICLVIADMDPGRDSIIYRMTSTRMKKDN